MSRFAHPSPFLQSYRSLPSNHYLQKVRERYLASPVESDTLQDLVKTELAEKKHVAAEGLLWLVRGLQFTCLAIRKNVDNGAEELSASFTNAYENTLKKHHSFVVRPIFSLAMKACPYRQDFYLKLGDDQEKVKQQLEEWLVALERIIAILSPWIEGIMQKGWKL